MYDTQKIVNTVITGNSLDVLREFPNNSIDMVFTSTPYFGLRSYHTKPFIWGNECKCESHSWKTIVKKGISGGTKSYKVQIKGEKNFQIVPDSTSRICEVCGCWEGELGQEPTPSMFVEHLVMIFEEIWRVLKPTGSCYVNLGDSFCARDVENVKKKSLFGIPDRFKIAMIDWGWICRGEEIWHKTNQMPNPVKDRYLIDYEKIFFFTKMKKYYFEEQLEPYTEPLNRYGGDVLKADGKSDWSEETGQTCYRNRKQRPNPAGRKMRSVWSIPTASSKIKHMATFPEKLLMTPIQASCPIDGIVLDPFFGSGTTGVVAKKLGRNWIGIEANPKYSEMAIKRLSEKGE